MSDSPDSADAADRFAPSRTELAWLEDPTCDLCTYAIEDPTDAVLVHRPDRVAPRVAHRSCGRVLREPYVPHQPLRDIPPTGTGR